MVQISQKIRSVQRESPDSLLSKIRVRPPPSKKIDLSTRLAVSDDPSARLEYARQFANSLLNPEGEDAVEYRRKQKLHAEQKLTMPGASSLSEAVPPMAMDNNRMHHHAQIVYEKDQGQSAASQPAFNATFRERLVDYLM